MPVVHNGLRSQVRQNTNRIQLSATQNQQHLGRQSYKYLQFGVFWHAKIAHSAKFLSTIDQLHHNSWNRSTCQCAGSRCQLLLEIKLLADTLEQTYSALSTEHSCMVHTVILGNTWFSTQAKPPVPTTSNANMTEPQGLVSYPTKECSTCGTVLITIVRPEIYDTANACNHLPVQV